MTQILFANNASTTIAVGISASATSVTLAPGTGAEFPSPTGTEYFLTTFVDAPTQLINEIVKVTSRSSDVLTIVRAQEGTTALSWNAGDLAQNLVTAGTLNAFTQPSQLQTQGGNYAADSGTANALVVTLSPVPDNLAALTGTALRIKKYTAANTGAATLAANGFTATAIVHGDGSALTAGELPASGVFTVVYNGTAFVLQSVAASPAGQLPPGIINAYAADVAPAGWLECDGTSYSTSTYSSLFAVIGYTFGGSSGSFNVPDLRGYFVRGWADSGSIDPGRVFGSTQTDAFQGHYHSPLSPATSFRGADSSGSQDSNSGGSNTSVATTGAPVTDGTHGTPSVASETRPINVALMYIIKT